MLLQHEVVTVSLQQVLCLSSVRVFVKDRYDDVSLSSATACLKELIHRFPNGLPTLDPFADLRVPITPDAMKLVGQLESLEKRLLALPASQGFPTGAQVSNANWLLLKKTASVRQKLGDVKVSLRRLRQQTEHDKKLKAMTKLMVQLKLLDEGGAVVMEKGMVAAELTSCDELVGAELLFSGELQALSVAAQCAVLSCLVCKGKKQSTAARKQQESRGKILPSSGEIEVEEDVLGEVQTGLESLRRAVERVAAAKLECGIALVEEESETSEGDGLDGDAIVENDLSQWAQKKEYSDSFSSAMAPVSFILLPHLSFSFLVRMSFCLLSEHLVCLSVCLCLCARVR